jgi:hypothetical protein
MKNLYLYIKENWVAGFFLVIFLNWILGIFNEPQGIAVLIATVVVYFVAGFLSTKVFKLSRRGPISWYGSPLFWVTIPIICVIFFVLV